MIDKVEYVFRFIQQEVQNLLHEIERRDNECRRLNHQAMSSGQQLEKTSDKLQSIESKSLTQAKEIKVRYSHFITMHVSIRIIELIEK
jgi:septal ring factor EnvC (AmiA/AmiB activator)